MTTENVKILIRVLQLDLERRRFNFEIIVSPAEKAKAVVEQNANHHDHVDGWCSPEIFLHLTDGKCDIQVIIGGALKPKAPLEEGEDIIEYNKALSECTKFLYLVPTYVDEAEGIATIKFKVNGKIRHTAYVNDIPTERTNLRLSCASSCKSQIDDRSRYNPDDGPDVVERTISDKSDTLFKNQKESESVSDKDIEETSLKRPYNAEKETNTEKQLVKATGVSQGQDRGNKGAETRPTSGGKYTNLEETTGNGAIAQVQKEENEGSVKELVEYVTGLACEKGDEAVPVPPMLNQGSSNVTAVEYPDDGENDEPDIEEDSEHAADPNTNEPEAMAATRNDPVNNSDTNEPEAMAATRNDPVNNSDANTVQKAPAPEENVAGNTGCGKLLSDGSLLTLALKLNAGEAKRLFVLLGVSTEHEHYRHNNTGDICTAIYESLRHWRNQRRSSREGENAGNVSLLEDLLKNLDEIGRKDLTLAISTAKSNNRLLERKDFISK